MSRVLAFFLFGSALGCGAETMTVKSDERVVFYPSVAKRIPGKSAWQVEVRGSIFEPEKRPVATAVLRQMLNLKDVELSADEARIFNERARLFLVDNERGKKAFVRLGTESFAAGKSKANGKFWRQVVVPEEFVNTGARKISFTAALPSDSNRVFSGEAFILEATGLSVISDVDDTIKITEVRNRNATLRNTFLREFRPAPGMAEFYQKLERERVAQFHYVSASPWQLYEPLAEFVQTNNFPGGTFALKEFRWKNKTFLSLFGDPEKYKPTVIEPLLKQFPQRQFILIGDSGERDPEVYAALARKYPEQIQHIYIRDVTREPATAERYQKGFQGVPAKLWNIFSDPMELELPPATPTR